MGLHAGQSYTANEVSLVAPDPEAIRRAAVAPDVAGAVDRWLTRAEASDREYYFSVRRRGALVGQILLHDLDPTTGEALVGYHLFDPALRGRGIGTAMLGLLQRFVAQETGMRRLVIITEDANQASRRIAEKCGFVCVGAPREDPLHGLVYEWRVPASAVDSSAGR
jgi:RimJ/RimL family protein N-acetyltransferase